MSTLVLTGYALATSWTFVATLVVIAKTAEQPSVRVAVTLTNALILVMLVYGAVHA